MLVISHWHGATTSLPGFSDDFATLIFGSTLCCARSSGRLGADASPRLGSAPRWLRGEGHLCCGGGVPLEEMPNRRRRVSGLLCLGRREEFLLWSIRSVSDIKLSGRHGDLVLSEANCQSYSPSGAAGAGGSATPPPDGPMGEHQGRRAQVSQQILTARHQSVLQTPEGAAGSV